MKISILFQHLKCLLLLNVNLLSLTINLFLIMVFVISYSKVEKMVVDSARTYHEVYGKKENYVTEFYILGK